MDTRWIVTSPPSLCRDDMDAEVAARPATGKLCAGLHGPLQVADAVLTCRLSDTA